MNGVLSARLSELGATSPPTMLEHEKGYVAAYAPEPKIEKLTEGLGSKWEILDNGFKFFPSILASHAAIQATLDVVTSNNLAPADIVALTNETYNTVKTHFSAKTVTTQMGARVSVPYCIAAAALDRAVGPQQFTAERVMARDVQTLLANTDVIADPELDKLYPDKFPARVTAKLRDGRTFTSIKYFPKGDPQEPLTPAEIEAKFLANASARYQDADARRLVTMIRGLGSTSDTAPLFALLGG
jgi:2-methylcitrate dehydratase PrpD